MFFIELFRNGLSGIQGPLIEEGVMFEVVIAEWIYQLILFIFA